MIDRSSLQAQAQEIARRLAAQGFAGRPLIVGMQREMHVRLLWSPISGEANIRQASGAFAQVLESLSPLATIGLPFVSPLIGHLESATASVDDLHVWAERDYEIGTDRILVVYKILWIEPTA